MKNGVQRHWSIICAATVAITFLAATYPLWMGDVYPVWDADDQFVPIYSLMSDFSRHGSLMLWSPWTDSGYPLYSSFEMPALSPIAILLSFICGPGHHGFFLFWLAHWFAGGVGVLFLGRRMNQAPAITAIVALGYLFGGTFTDHAQHLQYWYTFAFSPWVVCALFNVLKAPTWVNGSLLSVAFGLQMLGGYPGHTFATTIFCFLLAMVWVIDQEGMTPSGRTRRIRHLLAILSGSAVVALLIALPIYAAFLYEGSGFTHRTDSLDKELVLSLNSLPIEAWITLVNPYLPIIQAFAGKGGISMVSVYTGFLPLFLAVATLVTRPKRYLFWAYMLIAVFFYSLSCSQDLPVRGWLYDLVPVSRTFKHSALFRHYLILSIVLLALSFPGLEVVRLARRKLVYVAFFVAILSALVARNIWVDNPGPDGELATAFVILMPLLLLSTLWMRGRLVYAWLGLAVIDAWSTAYLVRTNLYNDSLGAQRRWERLESGHRPDLDLLKTGWERKGAIPSNDNLLSKTPTLENYTAMQNYSLERIIRDPELSALVTGTNKVYFAQRAMWGNEVVALDSLRLNDRYQESPAQGALTRDPAEARLDPVDFQLLAYLPTTLAFEIDVPTPGWILVADRWTRSWSVRVNDVEQLIWRANDLWRATPVETGSNRVVFEYRPWWLFLMIGVSWALLFAVPVVVWRQRRADQG